ncbi:MAG: hypothetical protein ABI947_01100 [Chloroflexota bacterium]
MQPANHPKEKRKRSPRLATWQLSCLVVCLLVAAVILVMLIRGLRLVPPHIIPTAVARLSTSTPIPGLTPEDTLLDKLTGRIIFQTQRVADNSIKTYIINADGTDLHELKIDNPIFAQSRSGRIWSPDGQHVIIIPDGSPIGSDKLVIYIANLGDSNLMKLTREGYRYSWSFDSKRIAYVGHVEKSTIDSDQIFIMNAAGSGITQVTKEWGGGINPSWSPDGKHIVFLSYQTHSLFTIDTDGSNLQRLTEKIAVAAIPRWSPDGQHIAFTMGGNTNINIVNADGSNRTEITKDGVNLLPYWSPDSRHIVYVSQIKGTGDPYRITIVDIDGSHKTQLTYPGYEGYSDSNPIWIP